MFLRGGRQAFYCSLTSPQGNRWRPFHRVLEQSCKADYHLAPTVERASFTPIPPPFSWADIPHVEKLWGWGLGNERGGGISALSATLSLLWRGEEKAVKWLIQLLQPSCCEGYPPLHGPWLGRRDLPTEHWVHSIPQRHMCTEYKPNPGRPRQGWRITDLMWRDEAGQAASEQTVHCLGALQ